MNKTGKTGEQVGKNKTPQTKADKKAATAAKTKASVAKAEAAKAAKAKKADEKAKAKAKAKANRKPTMSQKIREYYDADPKGFNAKDCAKKLKTRVGRAHNVSRAHKANLEAAKSKK